MTTVTISTLSGKTDIYNILNININQIIFNYHKKLKLDEKTILCLFLNQEIKYLLWIENDDYYYNEGYKCYIQGKLVYLDFTKNIKYEEENKNINYNFILTQTNNNLSKYLIPNKLKDLSDFEILIYLNLQLDTHTNFELHEHEWQGILFNDNGYIKENLILLLLNSMNTCSYDKLPNLIKRTKKYIFIILDRNFEFLSSDFNFKYKSSQEIYNYYKSKKIISYLFLFEETNLSQFNSIYLKNYIEDDLEILTKMFQNKIKAIHFYFEKFDQLIIFDFLYQLKNKELIKEWINYTNEKFKKYQRPNDWFLQYLPQNILDILVE